MPWHLKLAALAAVALLQVTTGCGGNHAHSDPGCVPAAAAAAAGHDQLLLQLGQAALSKAALPREAEEVECHTAVEGEECYSHIIWAMKTDIELRPRDYAGLTQDSSFEDFQAHLHKADRADCPAPCPHIGPGME
mmetsp:Transcript_78893/g.198264  ORF Transcript_78893/g.198264 Transcript_78893/m.198264 type:complete len:135 (+) Transcript_78893:84-488(+)